MAVVVEISNSIVVDPQISEAEEKEVVALNQSVKFVARTVTLL